MRFAWGRPWQGILEIRYDPDLLEEVVFHALRLHEEAGGRRLPFTYHRRRKRCYEMEEGPQREAAFRDLHKEFFHTLCFADAIPEILGEFPGLAGVLKRGVVKRVRQAKKEAAEFYVRDGERPRGTLVIKVRAETFLDSKLLPRFLRHEIGHVADMTDPAFAYSPQPDVPGENQPRRNLALQRFPLLWCARLDGRATRWGKEPLRTRKQRLEEYHGSFGKGAPRETFDRIWNGEAVTQAELLEAALDPGAGSGGDGEAAPAATGDRHAPCPLCSFPSATWEPDPRALPGEILDRIQARFPDWSPPQGLCSRCVEVFSDTHRFALPGPIVL